MIIKIMTISVVSFLLSSCISQEVVSERVCDGVHCGTSFSAPAITEEMLTRYRSKGMRAPRYIPKLIYPDFLLNQRIEGKVKVTVDIDKYGNVIDAKVLCFDPNPAFNIYAIEYITHWKFESSLSETKNQVHLIGYVFSLESARSLTKCDS